MLALLFEVTPKPDGTQRYLDIAGRLKPALEKHDGFLFIDRYRSLSRPDTILSHSLWRDEASLAGRSSARRLRVNSSESSLITSPSVAMVLQASAW